MTVFLNTKLPTVINHCLESYCGVQFDTSISQTKFMAINPIGRLVLEKANKLVSMNSSMKIPNISQVNGRSGDDTFFLNTKRNMVNVNSKSTNNGDPVSPFRIKVIYIFSILITISTIMTCNNGISVLYDFRLIEQLINKQKYQHLI